jgi:hypothetical protein
MLELFIKDLFRYYFQSKRKDLYEEIAYEYNVTPFRVYRLAHGRAVKIPVEVDVLHKLSDLKIINKIL